MKTHKTAEEKLLAFCESEPHQTKSNAHGFITFLCGRPHVIFDTENPFPEKRFARKNVDVRAVQAPASFERILTFHLNEIELLDGSQSRFIIQRQVKLRGDSRGGYHVLVPSYVDVGHPGDEHGPDLKQHRAIRILFASLRRDLG